MKTLRSIKVLLIGDVRSKITLIRKMLTNSCEPRFELDFFQQVSLVLECLKNKDFDVVLLYISLSDSLGLQKITTIQNEAPKTPIIIVVDFDDKQFAAKALQKGAQDCLVKGLFDKDELIRSICYSIERKRFEISPREHENYYRSVLSNLDELIFVFDRNYKIQDINKPFLPKTGHKREDLIGNHCYQYYHSFEEPCEAYGEECVLQNVFESGKSNNCLHEHRTADGSPIWVDILLSPIKDPKGHVINVIAAVREVTDRLEAREALMESNERYRILAEQVADAVMIVQHGKLSFANHAFLKMFGYKRASDVIGKDIGILSSPDMDKHFRNTHSFCSENNLLQFQCTRVDGRKFWVEVKHNIITWEGHSAFLATLRDIKDTKLKEISMHEEQEQLIKKNIKLRKTMKYRYKLGDITGRSAAMQKVYDLILRASTLKANVIISGESGTGKELIARTIHQLGARRDKSFVPVNCGAIPENLFESEFFGHKKGAFTGALYDKPGFFDIGNGGILFLDEVSELSINMQVKLLRAIEGHGYTPVGDTKIIQSDVFIIASTNRDLFEMIKQGLMRIDFFYRIHIIPIRLPPLRDRKEDIPMLIEDFLQTYGSKKKITSIPQKILKALYDHDWPGNIRELHNVLQRYLTMNRIDFIAPFRTNTSENLNLSEYGFDNKNQYLRRAVETFEKNYLLKTLNQNHWHRGITAQHLNIPARTLYRKMKKYRLESSDNRP